MAKQKRVENRGRPRKHTGEPDSGGRTGAPLSLRIDPEIREKLPEFIAEYRKRHDVRLSMTDVVELALTRLYREFGMVPPTPAPESGQ